MPTEQCVNCHHRRRGRPYAFHVGQVLSVGSSATVGIAETITRYQIYGPYRGFVCDRCALIRFFLRYGLLLISCVAIELVLLLGSPFTSIYMFRVGLQISAGVALVASAGATISG